MRTRAVLALSVLALGGLLAGCGDDDASSDALSKEEFIEQGDAICQALEDETTEVEAPSSEAGFADYLEEIGGIASGHRDDFAALEAPSDGEDVQQALLDSLDAAIEATEGAAEAASSGDTVSAEDIMTGAEDEVQAANDDAQEYGFEVCGDE